MYKVNTEAFKELMEDKKIENYAQLAVRMNVSRSQVSKVMRGICPPGGKFIYGFQKAFPRASFKKYFFTQSVA